MFMLVMLFVMGLEPMVCLTFVPVLDLLFRVLLIVVKAFRARVTRAWLYLTLSYKFIWRFIMYRRHMSKSSSRRTFRSGASRVHGLNSSGARYVMRGGIRL